MAERAQREAERQRAEAEAARAAAEAALARAQELAQQVNELEAELTRRGLVLTLGDVLFDTGQATLKPGADRTVNALVTFLNENPERSVLIEGFTDEVGSEASNLDLSQRRADAVRAALVERGIAGTRIRTRGYGEAYPVASNATAAGRQQNRRVEIVISDPQGEIPERN
ncbi:MAG: OmpA family protein [Rhodothermales bacterium]|nr:OmpA family protein [Rhodothermales bacterium]